MNIGEILIAVLMAVAGGAAGAAVINGINERWKFKANRKAVKEDRAEEKADKTDELTKTLSGLQEQLEHLKNSDTAQSEALKLILLDRILWLGRATSTRGKSLLMTAAGSTPCTVATTAGLAGTAMPTSSLRASMLCR